MDAEAVARWSAWPAVMCYAAAWALSLADKRHQRTRLIRTVWTIGWLALVVHVLIAMAKVHGWSWTAAYEHTAQRTQLLTGWNWGGGVWFNLLTAVIWGADVCRLWSRPQSSRSRSATDYAIQAYLAFMMFNATVVFGSQFAQYAGCGVCVGFVIIAWRSHCSD